MRKIVMILFILILPLQWITAAAADYCLHEQDNLAQPHLGHHAHEHEHKHPTSAAQADNDPNTTATANLDTDCPSCHTHFVQAIVDARSPISLASKIRVTLDYQVFLPTPPSGSLFRPPLVPLA